MTARQRAEVAEHAITYTDPVSGLSVKIYGALPREQKSKAAA